MTALLDKLVKIVCVTHLYELAHGFYEKDMANVLFLRAERQASAHDIQIARGSTATDEFRRRLYREIFAPEPWTNRERIDRSLSNPERTVGLHIVPWLIWRLDTCHGKQPVATALRTRHHGRSLRWPHLGFRVPDMRITTAPLSESRYAVAHPAAGSVAA